MFPIPAPQEAGRGTGVWFWVRQHERRCASARLETSPAPARSRLTRRPPARTLQVAPKVLVSNDADPHAVIPAIIVSNVAVGPRQAGHLALRRALDDLVDGAREAPTLDAGQQAARRVPLRPRALRPGRHRQGQPRARLAAAHDPAARRHRWGVGVGGGGERGRRRHRSCFIAARVISRLRPFLPSFLQLRWQPRVCGSRRAAAGCRSGADSRAAGQPCLWQNASAPLCPSNARYDWVSPGCLQQGSDEAEAGQESL